MPRAYNIGMETLGKLFGSTLRVKAMRYFLLNGDGAHLVAEVATRLKLKTPVISKELRALADVGFLKKKSVRGKTAFVLNTTFQHLIPIETIILHPDFLRKDQLVKSLKKAGKIKLIIAAGVFMKNSESRLDLFMVGDRMKRPTVERIVRDFQTEIGKEISYALFDTDEFVYRMNMRDKLVSDVLDFPHEQILVTPEFSTYLIGGR